MRTHNEYFRKVFVQTIYGMRTRPAELVDSILMRSMGGVTREELEKPYRTAVGYGSRRKSCPTCKAKLEEGEWVWSWGEYVNAKWHTVTHFCKSCYRGNVQQRLIVHRNECGCDFNLVGYQGEELPEWLTLPRKERCDV